MPKIKRVLKRGGGGVEHQIYPSTLYRYIRRYISAVKSNVGTTQASEFYFIDESGNQMSYSNCSITASKAGNNNEGIEKLIDGSTSTKYCTANNPPITIIFDFGTNGIDISTYNRYQRYTANDVENRDPNSWTIDGSNDNSTRTTLSTVSGASVTSTRYALAGTRTLSY